MAWVQRVLLAAKGAGRGHGSLSRECTCPGVRDVANAATVSSVEASAQSTSALHSTHAAKQSANILGPGTYGTGGAKVRHSCAVVIRNADTNLGPLSPIFHGGLCHARV